MNHQPKVRRESLLRTSTELEPVEGVSATEMDILKEKFHGMDK
jgi:hypothetical protein